MKHTHMQRLRQTADELTGIVKRLETIAQVLERDDPDSNEAHTLRTAANHASNSIGQIQRAVPLGVPQMLGEIEAADPAVFSNERCR